MCLVEKCYNSGIIKGIGYSNGGISGSMGRSSQIANCYNTGDVNGTTDTGGILGRPYGSANPNGSIINCYNLGKINNLENTNKIVGDESNSIGEILGINQNSIGLINCITSRDEIKSVFINNANNAGTIWEIRSGKNNGYPVLIGMD